MANLANANGYQTQQTTMPPKAHGVHRAGGGLVRTHSRTSSGGGSKVGLNELRLTQKEPPSRYPDKPKKNGHLHHEVCGVVVDFIEISSTLALRDPLETSREQTVASVYSLGNTLTSTRQSNAHRRP